MQTQERLGEVARTPFGGLKKICEEYSLTSILGEKLEKFHVLTNKAVKEMQDKKQMANKENSDRAMFPEGTMDDLINDIHEQREEEGLEI